jgi:hypothetical protein
LSGWAARFAHCQDRGGPAQLPFAKHQWLRAEAASLDEIVRLLGEASVSQRRQIRGLVRDRADIILPVAWYPIAFERWA